ncbi:HAD family hydrolase [Streptomyces sp. NPDC001678]|uniref:HAD family hydrolase n=1 Tax=Streptomyces sp. NPDC001678 TaxID=3364599 RepID=UPI00367DF780
MLILDFDGVVCDAFEECAVVTRHAGDSAAATAAKSPAELAAGLAPAFLDRFRAVRRHSRLLDHFMVALDPRSERLGDQEEFTALFDDIPADRRERLVAGATALRAELRRRHRAEWLGMHRLYPGIRGLLERHAGRVGIVTAKDETSVREILAHHGLGHTVVSVVGECSDKRTAVLELVAEDGLRPEHATFVDDNLRNALQVRDTGARALWAYWGYHTADDVGKSLRRRVSRIYLPELAGLSA